MKEHPKGQDPEHQGDSATRLSDTLESLRDAILTLDRQWRITYVNRAAEQMLKRSRGDLLGQILWQEFPEFRGSRFETEYRAAVRENQVREFEEPHGPLDLWVGVRAHPIEQGLAVYFTDITEQRQAREALAASGERFRLLARATNDAIWDLDLLTGQLWWNEGFETLFGLSAEEIEPTFEAWSNRVHPEDRERVLRQVAQAADGPGDRWANEYRFFRKDGTTAHVIDRGHVIRDSTGKPVRMVGGMNDLTERKLAEMRLSEQAALLDKASDAILVFDADGKILFWNKGAETVYGWTAASAVGRSVDKLLGIAPEAFRAAEMALNASGEWTDSALHQTYHGKTVNILARWTRVQEDGGARQSVLAIHSDTTEQKALEEQFYRAQRMESIGTLAGGLAHDLNNLLAPVLLASEILPEYVHDREALSLIASVQTSAKRGAEIIKRVLGFARGVKSERAVLNPATAIEEIHQVVRDIFPRNISLLSDVAPDAWPILADPTQIHQVLMNLCVNARDAMPKGGTLKVCLSNVVLDDLFAGMNIGAQPGPYVLIEVQDTGHGMTAEVQNRVFEPFFTTKPMNEGTGLGLSTVFSLVRDHGGFLRLESAPGKGATFQVYLPAQAQVHAGDGLFDAPSSCPPRGDGQRPRGQRLAPKRRHAEPRSWLLKTPQCKEHWLNASCRKQGTRSLGPPRPTKRSASFRGGPFSRTS
jgi:PAS domain S-box-containing protein